MSRMYFIYVHMVETLAPFTEDIFILKKVPLTLNTSFF